VETPLTLLKYRNHWLDRGYRIGVPVDEPPAAVFSAKDARDPEIHRRGILPSAYLGLESLLDHLIQIFDRVPGPHLIHPLTAP